MQNKTAKLALNHRHRPTSGTARLAGRCAVLLLLAAALLAAGCASSGTPRHAGQVGAGIAEFRQLVINTRDAVGTVLRSLDEVATQADHNPRPAFKRFDEALHQLEVVSVKTRARADAMRARGDAYFDEWEEQLSGTNDEQARKTAVERRAQLRTTFAEIRRNSQQVREEFKSFLSNLRDLRILLGNDLTVTGVDAAKPVLLKTKSDGLRVQQSLNKVVAELNSVAATLSAGSAPRQP